MIGSLLIAYPKLVEVPGKWEVCWHMEMPVLYVFSIVKELPSMAFSLLPSNILCHTY